MYTFLYNLSMHDGRGLFIDIVIIFISYFLKLARLI